MALVAVYDEVTTYTGNTDENEPQAAEIRRIQQVRHARRRCGVRHPGVVLVPRRRDPRVCDSAEVRRRAGAANRALADPSGGASAEEAGRALSRLPAPGRQLGPGPPCCGQHGAFMMTRQTPLNDSPCDDPRDALRRLQETRPRSLLAAQASVPHRPRRSEKLENRVGATGKRDGTITQHGPAA
jgi:hypothetical protein